jgi:thiamine-phosphate pyrophosphorylase
MLSDQLSVYLVADPDHTDRDLVEVVKAALAGGVTAVQFRAKSGTDRENCRLAESIQRICKEHSVLFVVNDRVDIALASGADGVHLGTWDLPVETVRELAPAGFVIGFSPADDTETEQASSKGSDYMGIGPVFTTHSKNDAGNALGLEAFSRRTDLAGIPCIGIGGIDAGNASSVIEAGAVGVAVLSAIIHAPDPEKAAREISAVVQEAKCRGRSAF